MTEAQWNRLSPRRQNRILEKMRVSTVAAWSLTPIQLHRILNGFFEGVSTMKKPRRKHGKP